MEITKIDENTILGMFPELTMSNRILEGTLKFAANFLKDQNSYEILDPKIGNAPINGEFKIQIDFSKSNPYREVYETGGKIMQLAEKLNIKNLSDLHVNKTIENGSVKACIAGYLQENQNIGFIRFIFEVVVPFFCDIVVFEKNEGKLWPRGEFSHGALGILENYSEQLMLTKDIAGLTEQCIDELSKQGKDFEALKQFLGFKKKLNGGWTGFNKNEPTKKLRDIIGRKSFDGLWRLKDNLKKYNLLSKILL